MLSSWCKDASLLAYIVYITAFQYVITSRISSTLEHNLMLRQQWILYTSWFTCYISTMVSGLPKYHYTHNSKPFQETMCKSQRTVRCWSRDISATHRWLRNSSLYTKYIHLFDMIQKIWWFCTPYCIHLDDAKYDDFAHHTIFTLIILLTVLYPPWWSFHFYFRLLVGNNKIWLHTIFNKKLRLNANKDKNYWLLQNQNSFSIIMLVELFPDAPCLCFLISQPTVIENSRNFQDIYHFLCSFDWYTPNFFRVLAIMLLFLKM